jgi:hypothetical protein
MQLTLPSTFRWGPRLRTLHSTRIAFPSFPQLLSPCHDLVDLQLHEIPSAGYFPPEAFANALSGMTQLRSLTLHLLSFPRRRSYLSLPPPPGERIVLPALTTSNIEEPASTWTALWLESTHLISGISDITFFSQPTMDASQLGRFIERIEMQSRSVKRTLKPPRMPFPSPLPTPSGSTPLRLQISCEQLDWQLSCMAQVCDQFSPFLFRVNNLGINTTQPSGQ